MLDFDGKEIFMKKIFKIVSIAICAAACFCAVKKTVAAAMSCVAAFKTVKIALSAFFKKRL